jgi:hypothetical protein
VEVKTGVVREKLPVSSVPLDRKMPKPVLVEVKELPSVHPPPAPLKVTELVMVRPFVVIVLPVEVLEKINPPVMPAMEPAAIRDKLPAIVINPAPENVTVPADTVQSRQLAVVAAVTVYVPA